jgi:hypothetical protein
MGEGDRTRLFERQKRVVSRRRDQNLANVHRRSLSHRMGEGQGEGFLRSFRDLIPITQAKSFVTALAFTNSRGCFK